MDSVTVALMVILITGFCIGFGIAMAWLGLSEIVRKLRSDPTEYDTKPVLRVPPFTTTTENDENMKARGGRR